MTLPLGLYDPTTPTHTHFSSTTTTTETAGIHIAAKKKQSFMANSRSNSPYAGVAARYLDTKKDSTASMHTQEVRRETFPVNPAFRSVTPRYTDIHPPAPQPDAKAAGNASPLESWSEIKDHRAMAAQLGFGGTISKFREAAERADRSSSPVSPRRIVEMGLESRKSETHWRSTTSRVHTAFSDLVKETERARPGTVSPGRSPRPASKAATSSVAEYIRHNTPIKHHCMQGEKVIPAAKRDDSPRRLAPWHSGGVVEKQFEEIRRQMSKKNHYVREEKRVKEERERRNAVVKGRQFVPRVAKLAPAYLIPGDLPTTSTTSETKPSAAATTASPTGNA